MDKDCKESSNRDLTSLPATYKKLSDMDIEQGIKNNSKTQDGANEKMLASDKKSVSNEAEGKFISSEKKNGDAKVDIDDLRTAFVGMGKEELLRYANDPFWIRLRWVLFILFWLVWLAMLLGAIAIIIAAPKCSAPEPRKWWEKGPLIEIESIDDLDDLKRLKEIGVEGVILSEDEIDAYSVPEESKLKQLLTIGFNIIVDLHPGSSYKWFNQSENNEEIYKDYYIWASPKGNEATGGPKPPNNWMSPVHKGSSWKYSAIRNQFYLAQFGAPDLNFRNEKVVNEFSEVLRTWLKLDVKGFRLSNVNRLLVDEQLRDEQQGHNMPPYSMDDYRFYTHKYTTDQEGLTDLLFNWRKIVYNHTDFDGVFALKDELNIIESYKVNDTLVIDLPSHSNVFNTANRTDITAEHLYDKLKTAWSVLGPNEWPAWTFKKGGLSEDVLQILTFLLPGTPVIQYEKNNLTSLLPQLMSYRSSPAILFGNYTTFLLNDNSTFAYTREKAGQPGFLVLCNLMADNTTVDVSELPNMAEDLTVSVISKNYASDDIKPKSKVIANSVPLTAKSALILTYVRKDNA